MTKTKAREIEEGVTFSDGYFTTHQRFVIRRGLTQCLAGKQIGVVGGMPKTTNQIAAELLRPKYGFKGIRKYTAAPDLFKALDTNEIDAALVDDISAVRNYKADDPVEFFGPALDGILRRLGFYETIGYQSEQFGIAMARDGGELIKIVNEVIRQAASDGTLKRLGTELILGGLTRSSPAPLC
jgi:ABC-type amino acid transport substrate-binding protein